MSQNLWAEGEKHLQKVNPVFTELINKYGSCTLKPIMPERYFPTLIKGIIAQQVDSNVSQNLFAAFTRIYGPTPEPGQILRSSFDELRTCGISDLKIQYIKDLSQSIIDGTINFERFGSMDDSTIIKQLTGVRGLGRWTAELFLILALSRPDVLPADDFGLKKALKEIFNLPQIPQKRGQINALAETWRPWRSLAVWYLWQKVS